MAIASKTTSHGIPLSDMDGSPDIEIVNDGFKKTDEIITGLEAAIEGVKTDTIYTLTHSKDGTVHKLTGALPDKGYASVRFKATNEMGVETLWQINEDAYTGQTALGELAEEMFASGAIVAAELDIGAKTINFKIGGTSAPKEFGDGSDGDLIIKAGETVTLPVHVPHKSIIMKQYKSITIEAGGILTTSNFNCGLIIKCRGNCNIDGTIDQSGKGGFNNAALTYEFPPVMCGAGGNGGNGGTGGNSYNIQAGGMGANGATGRAYGGGLAGAGGGGGGGAGYSSSTKGTTGGIAQSTDNNRFSIAGSGGAGVTYNYTLNGKPMTMYGGNGARGAEASSGGGGLIALYVGGNLSISGFMNADGIPGITGSSGGSASGDSGGGSGSQGGGGGGGAGGTGGGAIYICYNAAYLNTGSFSVSGGSQGMGGSTGYGYSGNISQRPTNQYTGNGQPGTAGTIGEIKIEKYSKNMR